MAIVFMQDMAGGSRDMVGAVSKEMDIEHDPPAGMIIHTASELPTGGVRVIDVWESREALETFQRDRLMPALQTVMQRFGVDPGAMIPEQTFLDAFDVRMGAGTP